MSLTVETPPKDEEKFADKAHEIVKAAKRLGIELDPEGFIYAWAEGVRLLVERNDETQEIDSLLFMSAGKRWIASDVKASVLSVKGNRDRMLDFAKTVAKAMGATSIFYEEEELLEKRDDRAKYIVVEDSLE